MRTWTATAINCFRLKSNCVKCDIPALGLSEPCHMAKSVEFLLKKIGPPNIKSPEHTQKQYKKKEGAKEYRMVSLYVGGKKMWEKAMFNSDEEALKNFQGRAKICALYSVVSKEDANNEGVIRHSSRLNGTIYLLKLAEKEVPHG